MVVLRLGTSHTSQEMNGSVWKDLVRENVGQPKRIDEPKLVRVSSPSGPHGSKFWNGRSVLQCTILIRKTCWIYLNLYIYVYLYKITSHASHVSAWASLLLGKETAQYNIKVIANGSLADYDIIWGRFLQQTHSNSTSLLRYLKSAHQNGHAVPRKNKARKCPIVLDNSILLFRLVSFQSVW